jgi:hypothetical protein
MRRSAASTLVGLLLKKWRSKFQAKLRFVEAKKRFQLCFVRNCLRGDEAKPACQFAKTRTPPEQMPCTKAGSREPSWCGANAVDEGSAWATHGRASGSSRNVPHEQPIGHPLLETAPRRSISAVEAPQIPQRHHAGVTWPLNALEPFRDKGILQTPNWSQPGPTPVCPGWPLSVCACAEGRDNDSGTEAAL